MNVYLMKDGEWKLYEDPYALALKYIRKRLSENPPVEGKKSGP